MARSGEKIFINKSFSHQPPAFSTPTRRFLLFTIVKITDGKASENRVFAAKQPSGGKYAIPACAAATNWLCGIYKHHKTFCATFSSLKTAKKSAKASKTAYFALRKGSSGVPIWPISQCKMAYIAIRYRPFRKTKRFLWRFKVQDGARFFLFRDFWKC